MHMWGDKDFDWNALNEAIELTTHIMTRWGRIGFHSKEKYGTFRGATYFYSGGLHSLIYPGYVYSQFPKWLWTLECLYLPTVTKWLGINWMVWQWQKRVYNWAYQASVKRYPHIIAEIIQAADYPELIENYDKLMFMAKLNKVDKELKNGEE